MTSADRIECAPTSRHAPPHSRLVVGERLLIYIYETQPATATTATMSRLAKQGLAERDAKHYHRHRLVVASDYPTELLSAARTDFESVAGDPNPAKPRA